MQTKLAREGTAGLERLRKRVDVNLRASTADIRVGKGSDGIERIEAFFPSHGFSPHRHDTYAIGITLSGVQTFRYRGQQRYCLPGQCHILHPDEVHDGSSAADGGFRYRIAYIDPCLIQQAIGGRPLPLVENPVLTLRPVQKRLLSPMWDMADPIDALRQTEIASAVAEALEALSPPRPRRREPLCLDALLRVRDLIAAAPATLHTVKELERIAGLDRWTLARQFRAAFGTSPTHFRTMRQLDEVRRLVRCGDSLTDASLQAGFFDQSHMSRMFKQAYGLTPGKWGGSLSSRDN
jgi:AraC-like DNA-binding protein